MTWNITSDRILRRSWTTLFPILSVHPSIPSPPPIIWNPRYILYAHRWRGIFLSRSNLHRRHYSERGRYSTTLEEGERQLPQRRFLTPTTAVTFPLYFVTRFYRFYLGTCKYFKPLGRSVTWEKLPFLIKFIFHLRIRPYAPVSIDSTKRRYRPRRRSSPLPQMTKTKKKTTKTTMRLEVRTREQGARRNPTLISDSRNQVRFGRDISRSDDQEKNKVRIGS